MQRANTNAGGSAVMERNETRCVTEALDRSGLLSALLENTPNAVFVLRAERETGGRIGGFLVEAANVAAREWFGSDMPERLARVQDESVYAVFRADVLAQCALVVETEGSVRLDHAAKIRGTRHDYRLRLAPLPPERLLLVCSDVTAQMRAQRALRETKARHRAILDTVVDGIITIDERGRIIAVNAAAQRIFDYSARELVGQSVCMLMPSPHKEQHTGYIAAYCRTGMPQIIGSPREVEGVRRDGTRFPLELAIGEVRLDGKRLFTGIVRDITARKEAERALNSSEQRFRDITRVAGEYVWETDRAGRYVFLSEPIEAVLGSPREDVIGCTPFDFMPRDEELRLRDWFMELQERGAPFRNLEYRCVRADGSVRYQWISGEPFVDEQGRVLGYRGTGLDVTDRVVAEHEVRDKAVALHRANANLQRQKRLMEQQQTALERVNTELGEAKQAAEFSNQSKSEFLANMSHEIRTPMTAILGYADLLAQPETEPAAREECVATIRRNGEYLLRIINDILDLSKIEAGRMTVESVPCKPCHIVAEIISLMRPRAHDKNITLDLDCRTRVPSTIRTDPTRLRQVLMNLVANGIKFTEIGSVRLSGELIHDADNRSLMAFDVIDTGIGLTPEQAQKLFQPFSQADDSTTRKHGGTGLGLTISRRLARMLGGDIELVSAEPGRGSHFRATIATGSLEGVPLIDPPGEALLQSPPTEQRDRKHTLRGRILLAEDGPDNQRLISFQLAKAGAEVEIASNGREALEAAWRAENSGAAFDLILMDMQMPELDGYGAASELRRRAYPRPIVALTAHAMAGDRERCLAAGCDDYVTKPVDRRELLACCARWIAANRRGEAAATSDAEESDDVISPDVTVQGGGAAGTDAAAAAEAPMPRVDT